MSGPTPLKMLQEVMTLDMLEVANTLVKLYLGQEKIVPFLNVICVEEIQNTSKSLYLFLFLSKSVTMGICLCCILLEIKQYDTGTET